MVFFSIQKTDRTPFFSRNQRKDRGKGQHIPAGHARKQTSSPEPACAVPAPALSCTPTAPHRPRSTFHRVPPGCSSTPPASALARGTELGEHPRARRLRKENPADKKRVSYMAIRDLDICERKRRVRSFAVCLQPPGITPRTLAACSAAIRAHKSGTGSKLMEKKVIEHRHPGATATAPRSVSGSRGVGGEGSPAAGPAHGAEAATRELRVGPGGALFSPAPVQEPPPRPRDSGRGTDPRRGAGPGPAAASAPVPRRERGASGPAGRELPRVPPGPGWGERRRYRPVAGLGPSPAARRRAGGRRAAARPGPGPGAAGAAGRGPAGAGGEGAGGPRGRGRPPPPALTSEARRAPPVAARGESRRRRARLRLRKPAPAAS